MSRPASPDRAGTGPTTDPAAAGPLVVLVGVPGAGKTTVGRALAEALGVGFRDTDADVEAGTGRAIADIFVESGEPEFRRLEAAAVATALVEHTGVLALGGGAVMDPVTRARLAGAPVVWLRVGLAAASQRAGLSVPRPVLLGNVRAQMKALMDSRAPLYESVAVLTVDTDEHSVSDTVGVVLAGLGLADPGSAPTRDGAGADAAEAPAAPAPAAPAPAAPAPAAPAPAAPAPAAPTPAAPEARR